MARAVAVRRRRTFFSRRRTRSKAGITIPLAVIGGFGPLAVHAIDDYKVAGLPHVLKGITARTSGYMIDTGKFELDYLKEGLWPIIAGVLVHKIAGKIGINRAIAAAGIPILRV